MTNNASIKAMNKVMYYMVTCGYDDVKKLIYESFDSNLADHIFGKYQDMSMYNNMAFFDLYFEVDSDCRRQILNYIAENYNNECRI